MSLLYQYGDDYSLIIVNHVFEVTLRHVVETFTFANDLLLHIIRLIIVLLFRE